MSEQYEETITESFYGERSFLRILKRLNVDMSYGQKDGKKAIDYLLAICEYMLSAKNGRAFLSEKFNRNGRLIFQLRESTADLSYAIFKLEDKTFDRELRMFFIYICYFITRGYLSIEDLSVVNSDFPSFEEWFAKLEELDYYNEESLNNDLARLVKTTSNGRVSKIKSPGELDNILRYIQEEN